MKNFQQEKHFMLLNIMFGPKLVSLLFTCIGVSHSWMFPICSANEASGKYFERYNSMLSKFESLLNLSQHKHQTTLIWNSILLKQYNNFRINVLVCKYGLCTHLVAWRPRKWFFFAINSDAHQTKWRSWVVEQTPTTVVAKKCMMVMAKSRMLRKMWNVWMNHLYLGTILSIWFDLVWWASWCVHHLGRSSKHSILFHKTMHHIRFRAKWLMRSSQLS